MLGKEILKILEEAYDKAGTDGKVAILFGTDNIRKQVDNTSVWKRIDKSINDIYFRESKYKKMLGLSVPYYLDDYYTSENRITGIEYRPKRKSITVFIHTRWKDGTIVGSNRMGFLKIQKLESDDRGLELFETLKKKKLKLLDDLLNKTLEKLGKIDSDAERIKAASL